LFALVSEKGDIGMAALREELGAAPLEAVASHIPAVRFEQCCKGLRDAHLGAGMAVWFTAFGWMHAKCVCQAHVTCEATWPRVPRLPVGDRLVAVRVQLTV